MTFDFVVTCDGHQLAKGTLAHPEQYATLENIGVFTGLVVTPRGVELLPAPKVGPGSPLTPGEVMGLERACKDGDIAEKETLATIRKLGGGLLRRLHVAASTATAVEVERLKELVASARGELKATKAMAGEHALKLATWGAAFAKGFV